MSGRFDVFVSYGHADAMWVRPLGENLQAAGLSVFFDDWEVSPGDRWVERLKAGVASCDAAVIVCSAASLSRPRVRHEYEVLLRRGVDEGWRLVPVVIADVELPAFFSNLDYIDFRRLDEDEIGYRAAFESLLASLGEQPGMVGTSGLVVPGGARWQQKGPREITLRLGAEDVVFAPLGGEVVRQRPAGVDPRLADGLFELDLARRRPPEATTATEPIEPIQPGGSAGLPGQLVAVGQMLGERFLAGPVAAALAAEVETAAETGASLQVALEVDEPELVDLPWEALVVPGMASPLVLHPQIQLYRSVPGLGPVAAPAVPGPLRVLAVIASPERAAGLDLLDYEAELSKILDEVDVARGEGRAYVEVLNWGSLVEIRAALARQRFHVLHVSCHAEPGALVLETIDGKVDLTDAVRFADEALIPGRDVPLVVLAGCSTAVSRTGNGEADAEDAVALRGLARGLLARGVPAVLAMTTSVSDVYATEFVSLLYGRLAAGESADPLAALAEVRRELEDKRRRLPGGDPAAALAEWATPTLLLRGAARPLVDPGAAFDEVRPPPEPVFPEGVVVRRVGEFVGRRSELRGLLAALRAGTPGMVVRGIGGVGKSTLAAQLVAVVGADAGLVVALAGTVTPDLILDTVAYRLRSAALRQSAETQLQLRLAVLIGDAGLPWAERMELLAERLLPTLPVLLLLDNFEDNQTSPAEGKKPEIRDGHLAAFLTRWVGLHQHARLLVTSRHTLDLPDGAHRRLADLHLGPLSLAEARKLVWRLPALDTLTPAELRRAIADVGGHPRALEYLDALLAGGQARFADVDRRLRAALADRAEITDPDAWLADRAGDLDRALAETVTLVATDVLLDALLARVDKMPLAGRLLRGAAVYRIPVDSTGLAWQVADIHHPAADPARDARLAALFIRLWQVRAANPRAGIDNLGLSPAERAQAEEDLAAQHRPPLAAPGGLDAATRLLADVGMLTPAPLPGGGTGMVVHRWTATALTRTTGPDLAAEAHRRAAAYWLWRVAVTPQPRAHAVVQLLEAAHHQLAAGDTDPAAWTTNTACRQLRTWGAYDWAEQAWLDILPHLPGHSTGLSLACYNLGLLAERRGDYPAAEARYHQALALFEELGDRAGLAAAYGGLGILAQRRGDYPAAEARYRQALAIDEELGDRGGLAAVYGNLGALAQRRGDYPAAEARYRQALAIREELGDRPSLAATYHNLGTLAQQRGDYPAAEACYRQALAIREELGDRAGHASTLTSLGTLAERRGDYPAAEARYRQALILFEELGDPDGLSDTYAELGVLAQQRGDYPAAEARYRQALAIREELGNRGGIAATYLSLGTLAQQRGDYPAAEARYRQALAIREELGDRAGIAATYLSLGTLAERRGDYPAAEARYRQALAIDQELGDRASLAVTYSNLGVLAQRREDYPAAEAGYRQALAIFEELGDRAGLATTCMRLGTLAEQRGGYPAAEARYRQALAVFEELGHRAGVADALSNLGVLAQRREDYPAAEAHYRQALAIFEELGKKDEIAVTYSNLGALAEQLGGYPAAEARYRQALALFEELGNRAGVADAIDNLATLAQQRGDYPAAEAHYRQALRIFEELGNQDGAARSYDQLGRIAYMRGDYSAAEGLFRQAMAINEELGDRDGVARSHNQLGIIAEMRWDFSTAEDHFRAALAIAEALGDRDGIARSNDLLGFLTDLRGD